MNKNIFCLILYFLFVQFLSALAQKNTLKLSIKSETNADCKFSKEFLVADIDSVTIEDIKLDFDAKIVGQNLNQVTFSGYLKIESKYCDSVALGVCFSNSIGRNPLISDKYKLLTNDGAGTYGTTIVNFEFGNKYIYRPFVYVDGQVFYGEKRFFDFPDILTFLPDGDFVDLGLPSGLKWATKNIGANTAFDFGNFYEWGETEPKSVEYFIRNENNVYPAYSGRFPKYNSTDGLRQLEPDDEVVIKTMGSPYRMPNHDDLCELCENCVVFCGKVLINGNSRMYTAFIARNGKFIIFPSNNTKYMSTIWSSTLSDVFTAGSVSGYLYPYSLPLLENPTPYGEEYRFLTDYDRVMRYQGGCIRAVCP